MPITCAFSSIQRRKLTSSFQYSTTSCLGTTHRRGRPCSGLPPLPRNLKKFQILERQKRMEFYFTLGELISTWRKLRSWHLVPSLHITSWQIDGETIETVRDFILGGSKITADGDCSHEIKRCLLLGRKAMTKLDSMLKSRDITLPTKVCLVKAMVFPVVMYGCESWTIKKAKNQRIDAFELWCCRRPLRVPWIAKRSTSQS